MRTLRMLLPSLLAGWWLTASLPLASAQQPDLTPAPAATPLPPPPAATEPPPYSLDLPDLPSSNAGGLFPEGPRQNPPKASTNGSSRNGGRNKLTAGPKNRGRALDRTLQRADSDLLDVRVAYRQAKTQALARHPELAEFIRRAAAAGTDAEKRENLRQYYTRLFTEVRRINPSPGMKSHVDLLSQVAKQRYAPDRRVVAGEEDLLNGRDVGRGWLGR